MSSGGTSSSVALVALLSAAMSGFPGKASLSPPPRDGQRQTAPAPPLEATARLVGRVVAANTGAPVRGARVALTAGNESRWFATTDDEGRYDIRDLPAGKFILRIAKAGFVEATPPYVVLKDKLTLDRGDIALVRGAVIVGRVTDVYGEPVVDVTVGAARVVYRSPGSPSLLAAKTARTNDLGEFRVFGLEPGSYFVFGGSGEVQVSASADGARDPAVTYVRAGAGPVTTFYPGTVRAADAQRVRVTVGETAHAHFQLISLPLAAVSGRVLDSQGRPASGSMVLVSAASPEGALVFRGYGAGVGADGSFALNNLQPGDYRFDVLTRAALEAMGRQGSWPTADGSDERASVVLTVPGDIRDVLVTTSRGFEVRGRLLVDGSLPPASWLPNLAVEGRAMGPPSAPAKITADGSFVLRGQLGPRSIRVSGLPSGAFVERVLAQGRDVLDDGLTVDADIAGVEISVTTTPAVMAGTVVDDKGQAASGFVIVMAEDAALWTKPGGRLVNIAQSADAKGFRIAGLPPGRYLAVAVADPDELEWASPENLERLRPAATQVTLVKGQTQTLTLIRR